MRIFKKEDLKKLYQPKWSSSGEDNGSVTVIGGSSLFHGAPILALKAASRIVDMVFFASPELSVGEVANLFKSKLSSFIWVPWEEVDAYIEKSDAVLIGPGMVRFASELPIVDDPTSLSELRGVGRFDFKYDIAGSLTRDITKKLLLRFSAKKWVIDAGSLQTMDNDWIPEKAILTPNSKELELLFKIKTSSFAKASKDKQNLKLIQEKAREYNCIIVAKGPETVVASPEDVVLIKGGNPGLTKGGSGDVLAGLTVALLAKNNPFLAACAASFIEKYAADELYEKVGVNYNMDDLADKIPETLHELLVAGGK